MMKALITLVLILFFTVGCEENNLAKPEPNRNSIPYPPQNVTVELVGTPNEYDARLRWCDSSDNENGFEVTEYQITGRYPENLIEHSFRIPENLNSFLLNDWDADTSRFYSIGAYYRVRAFNSGGNSPWSAFSDSIDFQYPDSSYNLDIFIYRRPPVIVIGKTIDIGAYVTDLNNDTLTKRKVIFKHYVSYERGGSGGGESGYTENNGRDGLQERVFLYLDRGGDLTIWGYCQNVRREIVAASDTISLVVLEE